MRLQNASLPTIEARWPSGPRRQVQVHLNFLEHMFKTPGLRNGA